MKQNTDYKNLLEQKELLEFFWLYPPYGFCAEGHNDTPVFIADFDLLTTLEPSVVQRLKKFPFFSVWSRWLQFTTAFVGTTITEYAPLPQKYSAQALLSSLLQSYATTYPLLIIKDLPRCSSLLSSLDNEFSDNLTIEATQKGFIPVEGQALAYVPRNFSSIDEYFSRLSAGRRKNLRRKMKSRKYLAIEEVSFGDSRFNDPVLLETMYTMYLEVFKQSEIHFDLLTPEFFTALLQSEQNNGIVLFYKDTRAQGEEPSLVGYNICLTYNEILIDKYIGLSYPLAKELNLYFISWVVNLEYMLQHNFSAYIAGWTDPEVKASLGASFTFTRHLVWVKNPLLRRILSLFRHFFESDSIAIEKRKKTPKKRHKQKPLS